MRTSGPQRISLSFFEDPLLATANATDKSLPLTPPLEEPTSGVIDTSTKFFDMKEANHSSHHEFGLKQSEPDLDLDKVHLVTHAKVYAIAEKYVWISHILVLGPWPLLFSILSNSSYPCLHNISCANISFQYVVHQKNADRPRHASPVSIDLDHPARATSHP